MSRSRITQNSAKLKELHLDARIEILNLLDYMIGRGLEPLILHVVLGHAVYLEATNADWFEIGTWWNARGGSWHEIFLNRFEWDLVVS